MAFVDALTVVVGNATKKTDYDQVADNTEWLQTLLDVEHDFDISTGDGKHTQITMDDNIDTTAAYAALSITNSKTAGVTDGNDHFYGVHSEPEMNQSGGTIGGLYGVRANPTLTLGTVTIVYGVVGKADADGGTATSIYGLIGDASVDGGTVTDVYGIRSDVDLGTGTVSGDVFGLNIEVDDDIGASGTVYMLYLDENTGIDYGIYQNGSANNVLGTGQLFTGGETANGNAGAGSITIQQGAADGEALSLKSSDVAHAATDITETDTYGFLEKISGVAGGLSVRGVKDADGGNYNALQLNGYLAEAPDTTKSTVGRAVIEVLGAQTSGSSLTNMTADANVVALRTYRGGANATLWLLDEDGDTWQDGGATLNDLVTVNDVQYVQASAVGTGIKLMGDGWSAGTFSPGIGFGDNSGAQAGIFGVFGPADNNQQGLSFWTHPSSTSGDNMEEGMRLSYLGQLLLGDTSAQSTGGATPHVQLNGTSLNTSSMLLSRFEAAVGGPSLRFLASNNATPGSNTIVAVDDNLGQILFYGDDGVDYATPGGSIAVEVDSSPAENVMPSRMVFSTTTTASRVEAMRIDSSQNLLIADGNGLVVGALGQEAAAGMTAELQVLGTAVADSSMVLGRWSADANSPSVRFYKSRHATVGGVATVETGDNLGVIVAYGDDADATDTKSSQITFDTEGTIGTNRIPGVILFHTATDAAPGVLTEAMRINSAQQVGIGGLDVASGMTAVAVAGIYKSAGNAQLSMESYSTTNTHAAVLKLCKSSSATLGTKAATADDEDLGGIGFSGVISTGPAAKMAAGIYGYQDGAASGSELPGRIEFLTATTAAAVARAMAVWTGKGVSIGATDIYAATNDAPGKLELNATDGSAQMLLRRVDTTISAGDVLGLISGTGDDPAASHEGANITFVGDGTWDTNDYKGRIVFNTNAANALTEAMRIDSSQRVIIGGEESQTISGTSNLLQIYSATNEGITIARWSADPFGTSLDFAKSRNATVGSNTIVADEDQLGFINWYADDGTNVDCLAAAIRVYVDGTPGENDMPGRMVFCATADGSASPSTVLTLDSSRKATFTGDIECNGATIILDSASTAIISCDSAADADGTFRFQEAGTLRHDLYYDAGENRLALYNYGQTADVMRVLDSGTDMLANTDWLDDQFDYVCGSCGWHGAASVVVCPDCGALDVEWHDDVLLLDQALHAPQGDRQALESFERMGVVNTFDTLSQSSPEVYLSLSKGWLYTASAIVQERTRAVSVEDQLRQRVADLETEVSELKRAA